MVGTNYILCSVGPNQNRIKTNKNAPNPKKAARRNARSLTEQLIQMEVINTHACL